MICFPNCKINLGLSVLEKRLDGFHNIETIIYPIEMHDILEIVKSKENKTSFNISGLEVDGNWENNLVYKAYKLLQKDYNLDQVSIHLHKVIPMGAGLGGGSANAAYAIKILNDLFELGLTYSKMEDYASQIGSDCPFFIQNKPVIAFGRGNEFEEIKIDLSKYHFVIVKPNIHIGTAEAYSWISPQKNNNSLKDIIQLPAEEWKDILFNDFEQEVFKRFPEIEEIKNELYYLGAVYASMTGSGAAVYGIFKEAVSIKHKFKNIHVWTGNDR